MSSQRVTTDLYTQLVGMPAHHMDTSHAIPSSGANEDSEDALKMLGRVADAFDNPGSLHKTDKDVLFVVNVVKSRHLLPSLSSEGSVRQDAACGSSFENGYYDDEDVEVVELGDVSRWEHASSYPYASKRYQSPRSFSERVFRQDDRMHDITKMLLTSSPLDRLDRLARMELKKTGWFERSNKWSVVESGLQRVSQAATPPKAPSGERREEFSSSKTTSPKAEKHALRSQKRPRREHWYDASECNQIKSGTPMSIQSPNDSQDTDSYLVDFSTLSYVDTSRLSHGDARSPLRGFRLSHTVVNSRTSRQRTRGRFGQVVRDFVKRILPPSGGGGNYGARMGNARGSRDSPSGITHHRWSGFWH